MSKGSAPRPRQVGRAEYERRWTETFGREPDVVDDAAPRALPPGVKGYEDEWAAIADEIMALPQADGHP